MDSSNVKNTMSRTGLIMKLASTVYQPKDNGIYTTTTKSNDQKENCSDQMENCLNNNLPVEDIYHFEDVDNVPSKKIEIISNIVIPAAKGSRELSYSDTSESICDDSVKDEDFNINMFNCDTSTSTSTSSILGLDKNVLALEPIGKIKNCLNNNLNNLPVEIKNTEQEPIDKIKGWLDSSNFSNFPEASYLDIDNIELDSFNDSKEQMRKIRKREKKHRCKFCDEDVISKNFLRHLERHHGSEREVRGILEYPKRSKERRQALHLLRNATNFELYITGTTRPNRSKIDRSDDNAHHYPCAYCKGLFLKTYLKRHAKLCIAQKSSTKFMDNKTSGRNNHLSQSQTLTACAADPTDTISKLNVKKQVFDIMKGDEVAFVVKKDLLIVHFGESYLKKHKRERMAYACSNRMRELARLLIRYREIMNNGNITLKELLHPKNFDTVLLATRDIVGYRPEKKTFRAPSLAMHLGTSLKIVCDELIHLILKESKGFKCKSSEGAQEWMTNIKNFKSIVESRWNLEISSLAHKDLQEKKWNKPRLLPLVSDVKKFRDECIKIADNCQNIFSEEKDDAKTYKTLVECALALVILFNRRRIGDVQFLKIENYKKENKSSFKDFEHVLTETEKKLTTKYKRVTNSGKGSREVVILFPEMLQNYINVLLRHRGKYISPDNEFVFATPGSKIPWGKGDVAIRTLAKNMHLENPQAITSNKLRKQIATVMQLLNLTQEEAKQFSTFMGHTQKTHEEFYELPIDIYQTAKVSKLLLLTEKGSIPLEYKGKSLAEINFNCSLEDAVESDNDDDGTLISDIPSHEPCVTVVTEKLNQANSSEIDKENDLNLSNIELDRNADVPTCARMDVDETEDQDANIKKKPIKKKGWSNEEIAAIKGEFSSFIRRKIYPPGEELKKFIKKRKLNRTVPVLKAKLQHIIKTSKSD